MSKRIEVIHISAVTWRDRVNGSTYHASRVYVNGHRVASVAFEYGHEHIYPAFDALGDAGIIEWERDPKIGMRGIPWQYCRDNDVELTSEVRAVTKREAKAFAGTGE